MNRIGMPNHDPDRLTRQVAPAAPKNTAFRPVARQSTGEGTQVFLHKIFPLPGAADWFHSLKGGVVRQTTLPFVVLIVVLVFTAGCGWWLRITEVSGTVTVDGQPAAGVQLVFDPLDKSRPRALARTGPDGSFHLGRQGPGDKSGAAAGKYLVRVMSDNDGGEGFTIPARYNVQSTLEFEVMPGQANVFEIDVDSKIPSSERQGL